MIRIEVEAGDERFIYDYDGAEPLTIGRHPDVGLRIQHNDVSRQHVEILPGESGAFVVRDLGSKNGTTLDGDGVDGDSRLEPGQQLRLGPTVRLWFGRPRRAARDHEPSASDACLDTPDSQAAVAGPPPPARPASASASPAAAAPRGAPAAEPKAKPPARTGGPADTTAPGTAAAAADEAGGADGGSRPRRRAPRRFTASTARTAGIYAAIALGLLVLAVVVRTKVLPALDAPRTAAGSGGGSGGSRAAREGRGGATGAATPEASRLAEAEAAWSRLEKAEGMPLELRIGALEALAAEHQGSEAATRASALARSLRRLAGAGEGGTAASERALEDEVARLLSGARHADAYVLVEASGRLKVAGPSTQTRLADRVVGAAYQRFAAVRDEARAHVAGGRALEAYTAIVNGALELRRLPFGPEVEAEHQAVRAALEAAVRSAALAATPTGSGDRARLEELGPKAQRALLACDFDTALAAYREILDLPLRPDERLEYQWRLYDARRVRGLFQELLLHVAETGRPPLLVTVNQSWKGEVKTADAARVRIDVIIPGEKTRAQLDKAWREVAPITLIEMYQGLPLDGDGLLALAAFAFEVAYEDEAHAALIKLFQGWPAYKEEAATLLSRRLGRTVHPKDLIVFEGRLIPQDERGRLVAAREEAKAKAKALEEELKLAQKEKRYEKVYDEALALLQRGSFVEGKAVLRKLAEKVPGTELGKKALDRAEDPFLRRRRLPYLPEDDLAAPAGTLDKNRVGIYFLGEGYQLDNDQQRSFDGVASRTQRILITAEPWREYATYFAYYAVNVESGEEGLDRQPGDIQKETPFGGGVNNGTYTVQNGLVRGFLDRLFEGTKVGVVLGNDNASVATGGGFVCAVAKGMVDVTGHEIGHALAGLGDEYSDDPSGQPGPSGRAAGQLPTTVLGPNLMGGNQLDEMRKQAPWRHWIALGPNNWTLQPVDLFEGGNRVPFDVWRPQRDCKMRTSSSRLCAPCMEQMILAIYRHVRPIDELWPDRAEVEARPGEAVQLKVATLKPAGRFLDVDFTIVRVPDSGDETTLREKPEPKQISRTWVEVPDGRAAYVAKTSSLDEGTYRVTVTVKDPTPWVQQADRSALSQTHTWTIKVGR